MLTADLIRPRLRIRKGALRIDAIDVADAYWQQTAAELADLFRAQTGRTGTDWQAALERYEGERVDYIVVRGLAKVLSDAATFSSIPVACDPVLLRRQLFARGPAFAETDLFHMRNRHDLIIETAVEIGVQPEDVETALFADRPAEYLLMDAGPAWTPADLLARYNLELSRGALYWANQMQIELYDTFKDIFRYLKLFKLMFEITVIDGGYAVSVDGPISPFYKATMRYGRQFAAFLPALFLCDRWQMTATVRPPQRRNSEEPIVYRLDNSAPLHSHFKRSGTFDSRLEADFAAEFEEKFGAKRGQWRLTREDELIPLGDTVMIPDFAITHKRDGRRALVELVGFWHPDYLRRKVQKVRAAKRRDLILVVYEGVNLGAEKLRDVPGQVLYFKNKPVLKDVMAAVEAVAR